VVGPRAALGQRDLVVGELNWLGDGTPADGQAVDVKIRSTTPPEAATLHPLAGGRVAVRLADPAQGVSPGQAAVFYDGARVLGGGWIERDDALEAAA
jgi:tRNA-specific 2-thiouridylase